MLNVFASSMLEEFILGDILPFTVALLILGCCRTDVMLHKKGLHVVVTVRSLQSNRKIFTVLYRQFHGRASSPPS